MNGLKIFIHTTGANISFIAIFTSPLNNIMKSQLVSLTLLIPSVVIAQPSPQVPGSPQIGSSNIPQISHSESNKLGSSVTSLVSSATSDALSNDAVPVETALSISGGPVGNVERVVGAGIASGSAENALSNARKQAEEFKGNSPSNGDVGTNSQCSFSAASGCYT